MNRLAYAGKEALRCLLHWQAGFLHAFSHCHVHKALNALTFWNTGSRLRIGPRVVTRADVEPFSHVPSVDPPLGKSLLPQLGPDLCTDSGILSM